MSARKGKHEKPFNQVHCYSIINQSIKTIRFITCGFYITITEIYFKIRNYQQRRIIILNDAFKKNNLFGFNIFVCKTSRTREFAPTCGPTNITIFSYDVAKGKDLNSMQIKYLVGLMAWRVFHIFAVSFNSLFQVR